MNLVLIGQRPCFGGFNPQNRGQTGSNIYIYIYMGVSKSRGTPKWTVKIMGKTH